MNIEHVNIKQKTFVRSGTLLQKRFYSYLVPTVIMNLALSFGVVIDGIIVGNILGTDAFSAVNLCAPVYFFLSAVYCLFGVGGSTEAARRKGAMDNEGADKVFTLSLAGLVIVSCLIGIFCFLLSDKISAFLSAGSRLEVLVKNYFTVLSVGIPLFAAIPGVVYFIRTDSKPKLAANILIVANVFNLIFDLIFMGLFKMGIEGAGLATVLGYLLGGLTGITYFLSKERTFKFTKINKTDLRLYGLILGTGLPAGLFGLTIFIKNAAINMILLKTYGAVSVAMFAVCLNILTISVIIIGGTGQTLVPILGCTYGEKDYQGIRLIMKTAAMTVSALCVLLILFFIALPEQIAFLFGITADHTVDALKPALRIFALSIPFVGLNFVMICYFQAVNRKLFSSLIVLVQNLIFILPLIILLENVFKEAGVWVSFVLSEILTLGFIFFLSLIIYNKNNKRYSRFLLLENIDVNILDVTIGSSIEDVVGISDKIIKFCKENGLSLKRATSAGLVAEELVTNIIKFGKKQSDKSWIDIRLSIADSEIVLRIRDEGVAFNPVEYIKKNGVEDTFGLKIVNQIVKKFEYTYAINFNNTSVSL